MPRPEKVQAVADIKEQLETAQAVFVTEYSGLNVKEQQELRRGLRGAEARYKVVKMTLAQRAAAELGLEELDELLTGPTAMAFAGGDPVAAAKALSDFAGAHERLVIKGGLMGRDFLTPEKVAQLARIEPREVLLAKLAGAMKAPMAQMAGLMSALFRNSAGLFQQLLEKKEAAGPAQPQTAAEPEAATEPESATEPEAAAEPEAAGEPETAAAEAEEAAVEAAADVAAGEPDAAAAEEATAEQLDTETAAEEPAAVASEEEAAAAASIEETTAAEAAAADDDTADAAEEEK